jgi:uncharacterized protein (DUF1800 family)
MSVFHLLFPVHSDTHFSFSIPQTVRLTAATALCAALAACGGGKQDADANTEGSSGASSSKFSAGAAASAPSGPTPEQLAASGLIPALPTTVEEANALLNQPIVVTPAPAPAPAVAPAPAGAPPAGPSAPAPTPPWFAIAGEGATFTVAANSPVRYGHPSVGWVEKTVSGSVTCSNQTFAFDPKPMGYRFCYTLPASVVSSPTPTPVPVPVPVPVQPTAAPAPANTPTGSDAQRLADQASFGPTESLVAEINATGGSDWVRAQMAMPLRSRYTSGMDGVVHQNVPQNTNFCDGKGPDCWRDYFSSEPLLWDFYRNAMTQPDQLRQRVAFALQQLVVISGNEVSGNYGLRNYQNTLLELAFRNYREVLKKVTLSPVMGDFLNNANNSRTAPNENYAREMLQLFTVGTCELNMDGSLKGGRCIGTYSNEIVRAYAYALTGWTYPVGGSTSYGCWPEGANCRFYGGDMLPVAKFHDTEPRKLLSGVTLAAGHTAPEALEKVLDSVMVHPNTAPFVAKHFIQHLVSSNPSPAYIQRVATAFQTGRYSGFGSDQPGDLAATVAAVLLDTEARTTTTRNSGKLREPALMFTGVLRALNGQTDGAVLSWTWGKRLRQHMFRPPSVFNYYPPNYPVSGTSLVGPSFALHDVSTGLERLNFLATTIDWPDGEVSKTIPNATGTSINIDPYLSDVNDPAKLVDRLSQVALGQPLQGSARDAVIKAVAWWTPTSESTNWKKYRVNTAAYLIFASPQYQIQR